MSETPLPTVDSAGLTRTADGTLAPVQTETSSTTPPKTEPAPESKPNTPQEKGSSFLTEEKPAAETKPEPKLDKDGKPIAPAGAPETYADFKLPAGFTLSDEQKTEVTGMFKTWNLNQDQAQQAIDYYTKRSAELANAPYQQYLETRKGWREDIKNSPDIGPREAEAKTDIARAINSFGDPRMIAEFRQALDITGAGDHPGIVRGLLAWAQRINEGKPVAPRGPSPYGQTPPGQNEKPTAAQSMYPNLPSTQRAT